MICRLRRWRAGDAPALAAIINNKKIQDNLRDGIPYPYTKEDADFFISEMLAADLNQTYAFAVTADDVLAGSIAVYRQDNIHFRTGELGYYLGEQFWGRGIGSEAVRQMCAYIFEYTDIVRIFAEPFAYNTASCHILEKNGFQLEGTLKKNAMKNGRLLDMNLYAIIKNS